MSRCLLVIGVCAAMAATAAARPLKVQASDATSSAGDARENVALVERELAARLAATTCDGCHVDASVTVLRGGDVSITAQLRIAVSDDRGVMLSVITGCAHATASSARTARLASLRTEALTAAVDGSSRKVASVLARAGGHRDAWLVVLLRGWLRAPMQTS